MKKKSSSPSADGSFLICLIALVLLGLVVLYSASYPLGVERHGDAIYFLRRQIIFLAIGMVGFTVCMRFPYRYWAKGSWLVLGIAALFLLFLFVPGMGVTAGGARRWISFGWVQFQPSEFAKFAVILYLANSLFQKEGRMKKFSVGILPHLLIPGAFLVLVLLQPDFGSFMTLGAMVLVMVFIGGARWRHLVGVSACLVPIVYFLIFRVEYRRRRFLAFLDPWADAQDSGFQIIQSHLAFHRGGWTGVGLGEGQQKLFYLPDIHTDFVFSVIGEEMGYVGVTFLVALFVIFALKGFGIALRAQRQGAMFACYLATGLTLLIAIPAFLNMAIVLGLLPTKGMVLPFISYGGSALVLSLAACGILWHIAKDNVLQEPRVT